MTRFKKNALRIVCLSHDSIDMLIALGAHEMIVGKPAGERRKEVSHAGTVGGYGRIHPEKIRSLSPDVILAYATFQMQQTDALIDDGFNVLTLGHHNFEGVFQSLRLLARLTDTTDAAARVAGEMRARMDSFETRNNDQPRKRIYFEEWDEPMVVAPEWVSEIIHLAGGIDVFAETSRNPEFGGRAISVGELIAANPEVIVASWCGKPVKKATIESRPGIGVVDAVKNNQIFEVAGDCFLQPGPGILNGVSTLYNILHPDQPVSVYE